MTGEHNVVPTLKLLDGPVAGSARAFELDRDVTVIGRSRECDIVLNAETVSKAHAEVRRISGGFEIADLKSRNQTQINGRFIKSPTRLRHGDRIGICEFNFVYHCPILNLSDDEDISSTILGSVEMSSSSGTEHFKVKAEDKLPVVLEISREIGNSLNLREVLEKTLGRLFMLFPQADRGFVLLDDQGEGDLVPQAIRYRRDQPEQLTLSRTVFDHVMKEGKAILSSYVPGDSRFKQSSSLLVSEIRTMMCAPLMDQQRRPLGILQIDTKNQKSQFTQEDLDVLAAVAASVGLAVENARLHENMIHLKVIEETLRNAHDVQMALLPERRPEIDRYEFWDAYEPADEVGGDYYDYVPILRPSVAGAVPQMRWAITVGDVSGKGMSAALLMAKLCSEVRLSLHMEVTPAKVVARLNRQLTDSRFPERFITFILVEIDPSSHRLSVVNAGHMAPIIRRASGAIEVLGEETSAPPLTTVEGWDYRTSEATLEPGDIVVLYTDGLSDAMSAEKQRFGIARLKQTIQDAPRGIPKVAEAVLQAIRNHSAGCKQTDDITLVCFGRV